MFYLNLGFSPLSLPSDYEICILYYTIFVTNALTWQLFHDMLRAFMSYMYTPFPFFSNIGNIAISYTNAVLLFLRVLGTFISNTLIYFGLLLWCPRFGVAFQ